MNSVQKAVKTYLHDAFFGSPGLRGPGFFTRLSTDPSTLVGGRWCTFRRLLMLDCTRKYHDF